MVLSGIRELPFFGDGKRGEQGMPDRKTDEVLVYRWITGFFSTPGDLSRELRMGGIPCDSGCQYLAILTRIDHYRL